MQSILSADDYINPKVLEKEQRTIFRRLWLFSSVRSVLDRPNAYVSLRLAGLPVLLQNCDGEIRAFSNQCPHRLMPLQPAGFGQSSMRCPYHGWTFQHDGSVKSIPNESTLYQYSKEDRQKLCLKRYAVHIIGNLVFVNLSENPIPITLQFSDEIIEYLKNISAHFSPQAAYVETEVNYNWKLQYENVLDYNHVPYVHPKSFLPLIKKGEKELLKYTTAFPTRELHRTVRPTLAEQSFRTSAPLNIPSQDWHTKVRRHGSGGYFENIYLFPNVNFNCAEGLIFKIEQYEPISPDRTAIRFTMMLAEPEQKLNALPAILRGCIRNDVNVLHEDMAHLENLQKNLNALSPRVEHGSYEKPLISFAQVYKELLDGNNPW
ncbi:aromatic ring-hydroxylating oxygenase subunit alpha [Delftia tsuruhatensis]|uniref:aromatic ring-hydroxylating oxygenase subunit alpha n=1 Tax=Delftia tsuruhatensis TaxID=180282 RepID=UPI0009E5336E|nr:aromatic ring-hydroxylating dioxygenase subunit alpha [Delftia tsuruhatensis]